ncbi:MAG: hypothetical protein HW380_3866 [Magnetococcales bacterium]|nr:hypothetical protein [Magnetococcales bacterium]
MAGVGQYLQQFFFVAVIVKKNESLKNSGMVKYGWTDVVDMRQPWISATTNDLLPVGSDRVL